MLFCKTTGNYIGPVVSVSLDGDDFDKPILGEVSIRVKFDSGAVSTYTQDPDGYVNNFYITLATNHDAFVKRLLGASTLTVELTPFNSDSQVTKFDLAGITEVVSELRKTCDF